MFLRGGNRVLKEATIKGKNMLPKGGILFPLRVAPVSKGSLKGIKPHVSLLKAAKAYAAKSLQ